MGFLKSPEIKKGLQRIKQKCVFAGIFITFSCLTACTHTSENSQEDARHLALSNQWSEETLHTSPFTLTAFMPATAEIANTVYIYIEGDGFAWRDRSTPSSNPTPKNPLALKLAFQQNGNAAYVARPCQYTGINDQMCRDNKWWTSHRFAPEVINATNEAVDIIKKKRGASTIILVGYSGGGAVAALVAAKRTDIGQLITIAGNLDTQAWTTLHKVRPLSGSLNPADYWMALQNIPQHHYVGALDKIMPPEIVNAYAARFPPDKQPLVNIIKDYDHSCCWADNREIYKNSLPQ